MPVVLPLSSALPIFLRGAGWDYQELSDLRLVIILPSECMPSWAQELEAY